MRSRQHGATLMAMLAVLIMGAAWFTVTAISNPIDRTAQERLHNAAILQEAKTALIGYVAHRTAVSSNADPGALPCPEAAGNIGTANEGITAPNCTLPAVGRLPWRTLGLDKWRDAAGEPLWYVVSPGWAKPNSTTNTVINSNSTGQLSLDATADVVALIIAPGRPLQVSASGTCAARVQRRTTPSPTIDLRDYLECENATPTDALFATNGPAGSFNDQVLSLTAAELLPAVEAAVGARFVREFGPSMRYCGGLWSATCTGAGARVHLPFAAVFGDPTASNFQGVAATPSQGLLPLSFSASGACQTNTPAAPYCAPPPACNPVLDNRCVPALVTYRNNPTITPVAGGATIYPAGNYTCSVAGTPSTLTCTINTLSLVGTPVADRWMEFTLDVTSNNVGLALRELNSAVQMTGVDTSGAGINAPFGYSLTAAQMNGDASATVRVTARVPGAGGGLINDLICLLDAALVVLIGGLVDCYQHTITLPFIWVDQPLLHADNAVAAWYYRNGWHQNMYYAVSPANAPSGTGTCAGASCLSVFGLNPGDTQRALVLLPGRALSGQARPPTAISHWLEGGNANLPPDGAFWARDPTLMVNRTFNDRLSVVDSN